MRSNILFILSILLAIGCEKEIIWELQSVPNTDLVVEGWITTEIKAHEVKLTFPVQNLNDLPEPVTGATVSIRAGIKVFKLTETPPGSGIYLTDSNVQGVNEQLYKLNINYNGKDYEATTFIIPVPKLQPLTYTYDDSMALFRIDFVRNQISNRPAMFTLDIDWSTAPGFDSLPKDSTYAKMVLYSFNSVEVNQIFAPSKETVWFPDSTVIFEKKYSLTRPHVDFLRAMVSETDWRGNYFDVESANVPTNLSEGAIGFFGGASVDTVTIVVHH